MNISTKYYCTDLQLSYILQTYHVHICLKANVVKCLSYIPSFKTYLKDISIFFQILFHSDVLVNLIPLEPLSPHRNVISFLFFLALWRKMFLVKVMGLCAVHLLRCSNLAKSILVRNQRLTSSRLDVSLWFFSINSKWKSWHISK